MDRKELMRTRALQMWLAFGENERTTVSVQPGDASVQIGPSHVPLRVVNEWTRARWLHVDAPKQDPNSWAVTYDLAVTEAGRAAMRERVSP